MKKYNLVNNTLGWVCFVIAAVTYLLTLEPTASFWDCPEFIAQGAKLEVGHPPGNPIFMLAARFFVTIFGNDITRAAIAVNTMSALLSAATILLLFWTITHLVKKIMVKDDSKEISLAQMIVIMGAGICGALAYTWSDTFWFSAVESEVYAFSSFCTALVFWLILKWENRADEPHSDRYLVLIAYVIGVSIAVHLLNLLCIPAIVLVFYYRKYKDINAKGSLIALGVSVVLVAAILYGLVPGFVKVAQFFELLFVNTFGASFNTGVLVYGVLLLGVFCAAIYFMNKGTDATMIKLTFFLAMIMSGLTFATDSALIWAILIIALAAYLFIFCKRVPVRVFNVILLSVFVIFIGYSSYALLLIRASANTPMNQNAPDNVFSLASYLNREQYGQRPLFLGPVYADEIDLQYVTDSDGRQIGFVLFDSNGNIETKPLDNILRDSNGAAVDNGSASYSKVVKSDPSEPDKYVKTAWTPDYATAPDLNMLFTRIYSSDADHIKGYKSWSGYVNEDFRNLKNVVPPAVYNQWMEDGYAPFYQVASYLPNLQTLNTFENDDPNGQTYGYKASFMDNIGYFLNYQLNHMYWRYFMWNFAGRQNDIQGNGEPHLGNWISGIPFIDNMRLGDQSLLPDDFGKGNKGHNVFFMLPLLMGLFGLFWQSLAKHNANPNRGIEQFWVIFFLFFMTGIAIVLYLNQTPGQPRERDYAFAGSFYAFAIWVGMGVPAIAQFLKSVMDKLKKDKSQAQSDGERMWMAWTAAAIGLFVPLQMVSQTWDDHDRSHRYTTRDFGENYLNSLDENAIIFTNGDNDTFPLWYAQEVEGVRPDVRVVNLSYLGTDWYANQMRHPYYEAGAIDMLATPNDYGYDALAYSFTRPGRVTPMRNFSDELTMEDLVQLDEVNWKNRGLSEDNPIPALEGLQRFYDTPAVTGISSMPLHLLETPYMVGRVDKEAAMEAFGLDPMSADSTLVIPYIEDIALNSLSSGGFSLSKLLSFDMVANSIAQNFKRPIYFATTVPNRYYLGLDAYLGSTGLANQLTPFRGAPVSPMALKAYENIVSRYKWGGLDDVEHNKGLYLDETVRRMVSTMRNSMIETAGELIDAGDVPASEFAVKWAKDNGLAVPETRADMARYLLDLMQEKLPAYVTPFESMTDIYTIMGYLQLWALTGNESDKAKAEQLIDMSLERYAQLVRYAASLSPSRLNSLGNSELFALRYVPLLIEFQDYISLRSQLMQNPEANAEALAVLDSTLNLDDALYISTYVYLDNMTSDELAAIIESLKPGSSNYRTFGQVARFRTVIDMLGVDPAAVSRQIADKYNMNFDDITRLN